MENSIEELKKIKADYVKTEADKIVNDMIRRKVMSDRIDTCDYSNWDRELHRAFPEIASELRNRGLGVSSQVRHGVTEWTVRVL